MADFYKVGVHLAMTSNHAQVLQALSSHLLGVHAQVNQLTGEFGRLKAAIGGAFAVVAGEKIFGAFDKMVRAGSEIVHQQQQMLNAGMSNKEVAEATARAYQVSARVQTTTISENLKHLKELRYAFGDYDTAQKYLEPISRVQAVLNNLAPGLSDQVWPLVKSLESLGLTKDPDKFMQYMEGMMRSAISTGGRISPQMFFSTLKYARTAGLGWDESFISGALPRLIQEMTGGGGSGSGSGGPGNALMSAFRQVIGGTISRQSAQIFEDLGLLPYGKDAEAQAAGPSHLHTRFGPPRGLVHHTRSGQQSRFAPGAVAGSDLFITNPYEWAQQFLAPRILQHLGITPGQEVSSEERNRMVEYLGQAFQNRTAGAIMTMMVLQGRTMLGKDSPFEKDIRLQHGAAGIDQAFIRLMAHDPNMRMAAFTAQWSSMMEAFGAPTVPAAIEVMTKLTDAFTHLSQLAGSHPHMFEAIGYGIAILGATLVGAGGLAIVAALGAAAGGAGWLVLGIGALATAVALAKPAFEWLGKNDPLGIADRQKYWDSVYKSIGTNISETLDRVADALKRFWEWLKSLVPSPGAVMTPQGALPPGALPDPYTDVPGIGAVPGLGNMAYHPGGGGGGFRRIGGPRGSGLSVPMGGGGGTGGGGVGGGVGGGDVGPGSVVRGLAGNRRAVAATAAAGWRAAGMSEAGIAGVLANIREESNFNPTLRHPDQPRWSGEGRYSHGLYQEGGAEWYHYVAWLAKHHPGGDWRDPSLQTAFAAENLRTRYPGVWSRMLHARSREEAAAAYAAGYLKPARRYLASRLAGFHRHGVPSVEAFTGGADHSLHPDAPHEAGLKKHFSYYPTEVGKALRDHFGYRGRHDPDHPSHAIPPVHHRDIEIHTHLDVDGERMATNVTRHQARAFNGPRKGPKLYDSAATRPQAV